MLWFVTQNTYVICLIELKYWLKLHTGVSKTCFSKFNENYTAVVYKACQEIKAQLCKLSPVGGRISDTDLAQAILSTNIKLHLKEGVAAYKMHPARKIETGQNIHLDDSKLRQSQISARRHNSQQHVSHQSPKPGDTIINLSPQHKHAARDIYLMTAATPTSVTAQKMCTY